MEEISFDLVGKVLEEDIVSELGILLLKKGTILTESNILLLKKHNYKNVIVSENVSFKNLYLKNIKRIEQLFSNQKQLKETDLSVWFEPTMELILTVQKNASIIEEMYKIHGEFNLYRHSTNVGIISFLLGKLLRHSLKNKFLLWQMGVLHDIGKVKLSNDLFMKPAKQMSEEELRQYKQHPELGYKLLKTIPGVNAAILNAAWHHHEQIDGKGYPKGLTVKYLPIIVQIISVANKIDHLLIKNTNLFEMANELIEESRCNKLNPAIVVPFVRQLFRDSVGKRVILNDGVEAEIAFVHDNEPLRPLLYIKENDIFIDLRNNQDLKINNFIAS